MLSDYDDEKTKPAVKADLEGNPEDGFPADAIPEGGGGPAPAAAPRQVSAPAPAATEADHDAKAAAEENTDAPQAGCYRILIVEDARILRKMLIKILHDAGHVCDEASQGHEAMAYLRRSKATNRPYDLVITDLMMPEMDGWELIESMTEKKYFPAVPVVIITANATLESVKRSGKLGIKNFVVKPFESARVLETVKKAILRGKDT